MFICMPASAIAQSDTELSNKAYPCEHDERFAEFDFWIGEWDVHVAGGAFAGRNVIERSERGCVLIENWRSAQGGTGTSINYVDKITDEWAPWFEGFYTRKPADQAGSRNLN